jgi:hypothetical protein
MYFHMRVQMFLMFTAVCVFSFKNFLYVDIIFVKVLKIIYISTHYIHYC